MSEMGKTYDLAVIGGGPGGYVAAIRAAQLGLKVALIEREHLGGTCLNKGCIPTKALLHSAHMYSEAKHSAEYGIDIGLATYDLKRMHEKKDKTVETLRNGIEGLLKAHKVDVIYGTATICGYADGHSNISDDPLYAVEVQAATTDAETIDIVAQRILIATGSRPARPELLMKHPNAYTTDEFLDCPHGDLKKLVIIGGGVIGVEFATMYSNLDCEVGIIEVTDRVLPFMDKEVSQKLAMSLKKRGVKIQTGVNAEKVSDVVKEMLGDVSSGDSAILVSIGRIPNSAGLFSIGFAEPEMERGFFVVNDRFETTVRNIYAIGDVCTRRGVKPVMLAHVASAQGTAAVEMICLHTPTVDVNVIPSCVYTEPEIASITLLGDKPARIKTGKFLMNANGRTMIEGQGGFIKVEVDADTDRIVGATLMCPRATDMIGELMLAVTNKLTTSQFLSVMHAHPTFAEGLQEAVEDVNGMAIHTIPKR